MLIAFIVSYALSPIGLIPDFIPILGYLDDLIVVPLGISLALKLIPTTILEECRAKAKTGRLSPKSRWIAASVIILIWLFAVYLVLRSVLYFIH